MVFPPCGLYKGRLSVSIIAFSPEVVTRREFPSQEGYGALAPRQHLHDHFVLTMQHIDLYIMGSLFGWPSLWLSWNTPVAN